MEKRDLRKCQFPMFSDEENEKDFRMDRKLCVEFFASK